LLAYSSVVGVRDAVTATFGLDPAACTRAPPGTEQSSALDAGRTFCKFFELCGG
jgi:hypothetical protein